MRVILGLMLVALIGAGMWMFLGGPPADAPGVVRDAEPATTGTVAGEARAAAGSSEVTRDATPGSATSDPGESTRNTDDSPGVLRGTVTGPDGAVSGATVEAFAVKQFHPAALRFGSTNLSPTATAITGADGACQLDLPPNRYALRVSAKGHAPTVRGAFQVWPGRTTESGAIPLEAQASITGTVYAKGGSPIPGASIAVKHEGGRMETTSDERGAFKLEPLSAGDAFLTVKADGFVELDFRTGVSVIGLTAGERREVRIELDRGATITGRVVDDRQVPVVQMWVRASLADDPTGIPSQSGQTDVDGRFNLDGLRPDAKYRVSAYGTAFEPVIEEDVSPGATALLLVMRRLPTITVIAIDDKSGERIHAARGTAVHDNREAFGLSPPSEEDGSIAVPYRGTGPQTVHVFADGYASARAEITTDGASSYGPIDVHLAQAQPEGLYGRVVRDEDATPVEAARVSWIDGQRLTVVHGVETLTPGQSDTTKTGASGAFTLATTDSTGLLLVHSADRPEVRFEVPQQSTSTESPLIIRLPRGGEIAGRVTGFDGEPKGDVPVVAVRDGYGPRTARTTPEGAYHIAGLPAGVWQVTIGNAYAEDRKWFTHFMDAPPPELTRVASTVHVAASSVAHLDLSMKTLGAAISGEVRLDGAGETSLRVLLRDDPTLPIPGTRRVAWTGYQGDYAFIGVPPGSYELVVTRAKGNLPLIRRMVTLSAGTMAKVDLDVRFGRVIGVAIDADGKPIADAAVLAGGESSRSGPDGRFEIQGLPAGPTDVIVSSEAHGTIRRPIDVAADRSIEVVARFDRPGTLVITVAGAEQRRGAIVRLKPRGREAMVNQMANPSEPGRYVIRVAPGEYDLQPDGFRNWVSTSPVTIRSGEETTAEVEPPERDS